MKAIKIVLVGVSVIMMASCESNTYSEISGSAVTNPTYEANIKPIMTSNCTSCHNPSYGQTPYLETYDEVKDAIVNGVLIQEIEAPSGQGMPEAGRLPQSQIDMINLWAAQGFVQQ